MRTRRLLSAIAAIAALVVASCGNQHASDASSGGSSDLAFTATTVDGEQFDAESLAGKPALFWFWAPWCSTCAAEAPYVARLAKQYGNKVQVVGVASLGQPSEMAEFIERTHTASLTHLNDEAGTVWQHFGITAQSTFALVDSTGDVTYTGYLGPDDLTDRVADLAG
jgi:thiol-disulfide isomerase/thioredoxin